MDRGAVDARVGAFVYDRQLASFAYAAKSARAVWDPDLDGFRCPEGVTNGGQITNRFGVGCGVGVTRRLVNMVGNAGRQIQRIDDDRRGRGRRERGPRPRRRGLADRVDAGIQNVMGRAADLLDDEDGPSRRSSTSRAAERATSVDVARQRTPNLPSRQRRATRSDALDSASPESTDPELQEWQLRLNQHEERLGEVLDRMRDGEDVRNDAANLLNQVMRDRRDALGVPVDREFDNLVERAQDAVDAADQRFDTPDSPLLPPVAPAWNEMQVRLAFGEFEQIARAVNEDRLDPDRALALIPDLREIAADENVPIMVRRSAADQAERLGNWVNDAYDRNRNEREQRDRLLRDAMGGFLDLQIARNQGQELDPGEVGLVAQQLDQLQADADNLTPEQARMVAERVAWVDDVMRQWREEADAIPSGQQITPNWVDEAERYNRGLDQLERDLANMTPAEAQYYLNQYRDEIARDMREGVGPAEEQFAVLNERVRDMRARIPEPNSADSADEYAEFSDIPEPSVESSTDTVDREVRRGQALIDNPDATPNEVRQEARRLWRLYNDQLRAGNDGSEAQRYRDLAGQLFGLAEERELAENRRDAVDGRVAAALDAGAASEDIKEMEKKAEELVKAAKKRRLKILADYLTKRYGDDAPWLDPERSPVGKEAWREMYRAARSGDRDAIERLQQWKRNVYEHEEIIGVKGLRMRTVLKDSYSIDTIEGDIQAFNEATGAWENVGNFTRNIQNPMGRNAPTIYNALMVMGKEAGYNNPFAESAKAQGFQTIFNPHAFMQLKAAGFRGAGVSAAWNGRYVWGRVGFRPREAGTYRSLANRVDEELARFKNGEDSWILNEAQAALLGVLTAKARRVNFAPAKAPGHADYLAVLDAPAMNPGVDLKQRAKQLEEAWTNDYRLQFGSGFFRFAGNVPDDPRGRRRRRAA